MKMLSYNQTFEMKQILFIIKDNLLQIVTNVHTKDSLRVPSFCMINWLLERYYKEPRICSSNVCTRAKSKLEDNVFEEKVLPS